jgi:hypothetical protein
VNRLARYWRPIVGWSVLLGLLAFAWADLSIFTSEVSLALVLPWLVFCAAFAVNDRTYPGNATNPMAYRLLIANGVAVGVAGSVAVLGGTHTGESGFAPGSVPGSTLTLGNLTMVFGWAFLYLGVPILLGTWASSFLGELGRHGSDQSPKATAD